MVNTQFFPPIGLSGAAGVGKDTLCQVLLDLFTEYPSKRYSVAGDFIKNDLDQLLQKTIGVSAFTTNAEEKTNIRPLLVEYGRLMRNQTKGRYFIKKIEDDINFGYQHVPIITDIRYAEYEKDELFWLKNEKSGLLVFLDREGIEPANEFEEKNNILLRNNCSLYFKVRNASDYISVLTPIAKKIIKTYKTFTTSLWDNAQLSNMFLQSDSIHT
jgi:GTPase SAR1 family protein